MIDAKVQGIPDLKRELAALPDKLRKQALRTALAAGARVVRDEARRRAPVIDSNDPKVRLGFRKPGTVRNAISVRTSKRDRRAGNVGVFVNVRPAKSGQRGAKNPNDPFYWRWLEFGRKARRFVAKRKGAGRFARRALRTVGPMRAALFLSSAASALPRALQVFISKAGPAIQRLVNKQNTPPR